MLSRIIVIFTIFHLLPLALALVIHGTEYAFDLSSKLTLGRGIVFVIKALSQGWAWRARAWRAIIDPVVFRAIDVVAVPRLGSIVEIRILRLIAVEIIGELILVVLKILRANQPQRSLKMWVQRKSCEQISRRDR